MQDALKNILTDRSCLNMEELYGYAQGTLSPEIKHSAESHLLDCVLCNEALDAIKEVNQADADLLSQKVNQAIEKQSGFSQGGFDVRNKSWLWIGLAIVAGMASLLSLLPDGGDTDDTVPELNKPYYVDRASRENHLDDFADEWTITDTSAINASDSLQDPTPSETGMVEQSDQKEIQSEKATDANDKKNKKNQASLEGTGQQVTEKDQADNTSINYIQEIDIFRRENLDKRKIKKGEEDTAGGKAYSVLFEEPDSYNAEGMPAFKGGDGRLKQYLEGKITPTESITAKGQPGSAIVSFVINPEGQLSEVTLMKGIDSDYDQQILKAIKEMPSWEPATRKEKEGWAKYTLMFKIQKENTSRQ
ncbi:MAG: energy transducer TonB [Flavobacteriales bacterium]|nr:energy transducer TonB [Flavobacteriales bacterium]